MNAAEFAKRIPGARRSASGRWSGKCPAHDDKRASLSFGDGDEGVVVKCHAGCALARIAEAVGVDVTMLFYANGHEPGPTITATYDYHDERAALLYQVCRLEPKDFRMRRPDGDGWAWDVKGVRRVVYRLHELAEAERVYLCEGEKDADRLVALRLRATTTPGGAANWRDEYADQIKAAGVMQLVALPDHDQPGAGYASLAAASCLRRMMAVKVVNLPGLAEHGDVSDWLDAGHTAEELLALVDQAPAFAPESAPAVTSAWPELRREGFDLALTWPDGVSFALTAIRDGREGVRGELTVTQNGRRLHWGSFALSSTPTRETLRKKLEAVVPDVLWGEYLEEVAYRLTQAARQGEPIVTLTGTPTSPSRELLPGILYEGEPTQLFADGDTGKSLVACAFGVAVHGGAALPCGLKPVRAVPVAYLDWETSRDTLETRLALLAAGLGIDPPAIVYKRMTRPLVDEVGVLAAEFARRGIGCVMIDSKMFAVAGGEGAAFHEPITAFYNALRLFAPAASLVINHVTGADARSGGAARPFGGAFAFNGPRLIWEAKRDPDVTDATAIAFTCRKANNLPRRPEPFGLRFQPGDGTITVYPFDLREAAPQTVAGAGLSFRVRLALASADLTVPELAKALKSGDAAVRTTLRRLADKGIVADRGIPGKAPVWGLIQP